MLTYDKNLELVGQAIDAYQSVMNTFEYRDFIIKSIMKNFFKETENHVDFLGSFMVFDPSNYKKLANYYKDSDGNPTTEGESYEAVKDKLTTLIKNSKQQFAFFSMASILKTNNVSHYVMFLLEKTNKKINVKLFNSGLYYLSENYTDILEEMMKEIFISLGYEYKFYKPFIGLTILGKENNPQDYCRGGLYGIAKTFLIHKYAVHHESFCQTWCILMILYELEKMKNKDYKIEENYLKNWSSDQKELEISIRNFMLWIVSTYEKEVDFKAEFGSKKQFSKVLEKSLKTLHPEISIKNKIDFPLK